MTHDAAEPDPDAPEERGPVRTCAVTRERHAPGEMVRFVLSPEGEVTPDIRCKLPGRGVWVTARADLVRLGVKRQVFARSLKAKAAKGKAEGVKISTRPDLDAQVDRLLEADALQALSLANKAGLVVAGFAKVEAAIATGHVAALIHAPEGGHDGRRKLGQSVRRRMEEGREEGAEIAQTVADINIFTSAQLDLALGRTNVIHAAILKKAAGAALLSRARKLATYRNFLDTPPVAQPVPRDARKTD